MKKTTFIPALVLALSSICSFGQVTTVIDPAGAGGFELGETFEANGWILQNGSYGSRKWQIGAAQPGFTGQRAAFIGSSATNVGTSAGSRTVHFYRLINIPEDAVNVQVTFKYKQEVVVIDPVTGPNDYLYLSLLDAPTAPTGNSNTPTASQFGDRIPTTGGLATFTEFTVPLPLDVASGTDKYLVFTFRSNNLNDPSTIGWGAIDDIKLTYEGVAGTDAFSQNGFVSYPNPVTNVLNLKYGKEMQNVTVTNMLGQQVISQKLNAMEAAVDTSNLAKGTYIVTVEADKNAKTFKIVK